MRVPMADTALMPIPGPIDPVPVARTVTPRADGRVDLIGLTRAQIAALFEEAGLDAKQAKLRAKQVFHWLYHRGVTEFEAMTDIAKTMRPWLAERFAIGRPEVVEAQHSSDGTRKWLLRTADGHDFEMVFIPDADRGTLCVSSQVGGTLNCRFCHTGTMRLVRNLTPGEIVGQVMLARAGEEIGVNLAVSLHAVTKEVRDEIVPLNRKYGIEELLAACAAYPGASNARRITFEYVMLKDRNDSDDDARELVRLIKQFKLPAKVNLIPFNPWPGAPYECSSPERIRRFSEIVFEAGISAPVRTPRGRDIDAACGQLKTSAEKKSRAELDRLAAEKQAALG